MILQECVEIGQYSFCPRWRCRQKQVDRFSGQWWFPVTVFDSTVAIRRRRDVINRYLERRQLYPFQVASEVSPDLALVIVIPCFNEEDLGRTLDSLARCDAPDCIVEVLVVINAPEGSGRAVEANNARASARVAECGSGAVAEWLNFHALQHNRLPRARAGVGLARKIGMDEAAARIARTRSCDGVIVSLDADCEVAGDFLVRILEAFRTHVDCPGLSINFEHRLAGQENSPNYQAILDYELHLRYYVAGQRLAGFPYAFHTIGSSMACRGSIYAQQGGMNQRQAGEDFYFIQKLISLGKYRSLNSTTVFPDIRVSNRVPFGTGRAMGDALNDPEKMKTYAPQVFEELRCFCKAVHSASDSVRPDLAEDLPEAISRYLASVNFSDRLIEIERNVSSPAAFRKRIFQWFNAFRFMKFAQFASGDYYPKMQVFRAAGELAESAGFVRGYADLQAPELLARYRQLDREADVSGYRKAG
jgi:glycosyltransferase involved in cell wall biosynthesis